MLIKKITFDPVMYEKIKIYKDLIVQDPFVEFY